VKSKKKMQASSNMPDDSEFLKQFKKYQRNKKIKYSLRQIFKNGENFSKYLDGSYITNKPFFDLQTLNKDIQDLQEVSTGFRELMETLNQNSKVLVFMFAFQGSGKSYFCRKHLSNLEILSNVRLN
jgi:hypothetical protein